MDTSLIIPKHLGGHAGITHIDEGALSFLASQRPIKTMLDIGCGPGGMKKIADKLGIQWTGIDGDPSVKNEYIVTHDFSRGPTDLNFYDLGWSVEFVEHVEERFIQNFMVAFKGCSLVFLTHAPPRKTGHHHVNCQMTNYWITIFQMWGFQLNPKLTTGARENSTMKREFARETGLVFENAR